MHTDCIVVLNSSLLLPADSTDAGKDSEVLVSSVKLGPPVIELLDSDDDEVSKFTEAKVRSDERERKHKVLTKRLHRKKTPCKYRQCAFSLYFFVFALNSSFY